MSPVAIALWYVPRLAHLVKFSWVCRSLALKPSKEPFSFIPQSDLRITNIALGDELSDASGRTSVKLTYQTPVKIDDDDDDAESPDPLSTTVLGSLTPGKVRTPWRDKFLDLYLCIHMQIEQATVDLVLEEDEEYLFEIVGKKYVR